MAEKNIQTAGRQKGMRWLKRCNIRMLVLSIVMLIVLCAVLLVRINSLNETIENLSAQVELLSRTAAEQKALLGHLEEELQAAGSVSGISGAGGGSAAGEGQSFGAGGAGQEAGGQGTGQDMGGQSEGQGTVQGTMGQGIAQNGGAQGGIEESVAEVSAAHKVYLTFDDGPSANTDDILDVLKQYDVKATFFVVGREGTSSEEALARIVEEGHTLAMHSYSHKYSEIYASLDNFAEDFKKVQDYLYETTGVMSTVYRFPGGSSNTVSDIDMAECAKYLDSQGVRFFDWNISSGDGGSVVLPVETLLENCTANISRYSTSVILMHDSPKKMTTLEALPKIIETIQAMDDTVILPITEGTKTVQHIKWQEEDLDGAAGP